MHDILGCFGHEDDSVVDMKGGVIVSSAVLHFVLFCPFYQRCFLFSRTDAHESCWRPLVLGLCAVGQGARRWSWRNWRMACKVRVALQVILTFLVRTNWAVYLFHVWILNSQDFVYCKKKNCRLCWALFKSQKSPLSWLNKSSYHLPYLFQYTVIGHHQYQHCKAFLQP